MISDCLIENILDLSEKDYSISEIKEEIFNLKNNHINFVYLGQKSYRPIWELQQQLHDAVKNEVIPSTVLLLEHDHVYTFGKNANKDFLLNSYPKDIDVVETDRGGQVTYHGPGQIVGYPIINLNHFKKSVSWYMRSLEKVIIMTLDDYNITAERKDGMTGVWVDDEKICAMGVRLSRWVTMHGFALNLIPKMEYYDSMIPCGIQEYGITSMSDILSEDIPKHEVIESLSTNFTKIFNIEEI